ncbi:MAG: hypothetical protein V3T66_03035 [Alphaproteobacteria bacterium]
MNVAKTDGILLLTKSKCNFGLNHYYCPGIFGTRGPKMKRKGYRDRTVIFATMALAYVFLANGLGPLGKNRFEIFPFFNWNLFTNATKETRFDYAIYIEKLNGRSLPTPTLVYRLKGKFKAIGDGINLRKATLTLAFATLENDAEKAQKIRTMIERTYLPGPEQFSYSVRLITYKPLERYRNGKVSPVKILGHFEMRK